MTVPVTPATQSNSAAAPAGDTVDGANPKRDLLLGVVGFLAFLLVSFGLMVTLGSTRGGSSLGDLVTSVFGQGQALTLELLHTNDTWGYLYACG